jgi:hypothetical protein
MNFATESMSVPAWAYGHSDLKYIKAIHHQFGTMSLKNYPKFNFLDLAWWTFFKKIKIVSLLNYIHYDKENVMSILQQELGWKYYGGKHYESVYTRFLQGYILPLKFNIDKRRGHISDLIRSGQLTREVALKKIEEPIYDNRLLKQDKTFVLKKLILTENEFDQLMNLPNKSYKDYPNSAKYVSLIKHFVNDLRKLGLYSK